MNTKSLANLMKTIVVMLGLCGAVMFGLAVPFVGFDLANTYPEYSHCLIPWLIFIFLMAVPCYAVLTFAWKIAASIAKNDIFTTANSIRLKNVAILALCTSIYLFVGNVVFLLLNMNHFSVLLGSMLVAFIGICITAASAVLSHLVQKAAALQEENDLTI